MLVKDKDILVEDPEKKDGDNAEKSPAPQNAAQGTKSNKHYGQSSSDGVFSKACLRNR